MKSRSLCLFPRSQVNSEITSMLSMRLMDSRWAKSFRCRSRGRSHINKSQLKTNLPAPATIPTNSRWTKIMAKPFNRPQLCNQMKYLKNFVNKSNMILAKYTRLVRNAMESKQR